MGIKPRARRADRFTVCMELVDVARDDAGRLLVLAGYPHPTNDWGWSSWDVDGPYLDDSDWNRPWDRQVYLSQITVEPEEVGQTISDVEWEADHARVLVQLPSGKWEKQELPFPCHRFRRLPGLGLCAVGWYGLAIHGAGGWSKLELAVGKRPVPCALIDAVAAGDRIVGVNRDGEGNVGFIEVGRELRWKPLADGRLDGMYAALSAGGRVLVAGNPGILAVVGDKLERVVRGQRRGFRTLAGDDESAYAGTTSGDIVSIPRDGRPRTFGLRFSRAPSIACFGGAVYASAGRDVRVIDRNGLARNIEVPMPGRGSITMRELGGELFAVCSHHLAVGDGASWSLIPFR